jgi:hypothetical protein
MKPLLGWKKLWCQAAELSEFCDHVGLVSITHFDRYLSPVDVLAAARVNQP